MLRRTGLLTIALALVAACLALAQDPSALKLNADAAERGWIGLRIDAPAGSIV